MTHLLAYLRVPLFAFSILLAKFTRFNLRINIRYKYFSDTSISPSTCLYSKIILIASLYVPYDSCKWLDYIT